MTVFIREVATKKDWNCFYQLPRQLYWNNPCWIPPLQVELEKQLNIQKNPFFLDAKINYWLAFINTTCVGRIAGIINLRHNGFYKDKTGFFGYFECIDNPSVAAALLDKVSQWLQSNDLNKLVGPVNLSTADECGCLIEGFNRPPVIQMTYNLPYYASLLELNGLSKEKDLLAFYLTDAILKNEKLTNKLYRMCEWVKSKDRIQFREFNFSDFNQELVKIQYLFNEFMYDNWGFVPLTETEILFAAQTLKQIVKPQLCFFAELDGKPIGFSMSVPDINQVLAKLDGSLFPTGIFKYLYYKNSISQIRVMLMGIAKAYRRRGLEAVFYQQTMIAAHKLGIKSAELSWISEDNTILIKELTNMGACHYKTYRVYQKSLTLAGTVAK